MADKDYTFTTVPEAGADVDSLLQTVNALRQNVQTLIGQRNTNAPSVVDQAKSASTGVQRLQEQYTKGAQSTAKIIDEVKAEADGISASGKLKFIATAGPEGYYAEYKLALKAGAAVAGFSVLAKRNDDGTHTSAISFTAEQFKLFDPTLNNGQENGPTTVFAYMGGVFQFNVPIRVLGDQIEIAGCSNSALVINNDPNAVNVVAPLTTRDHAQVDIYCLFDGQPQQGYPIAQAAKKLHLERINPDGSVTALRDVNVQFFVYKPGSGDPMAYFSQTGMMYRDMPPAGNNQWRLSIQGGASQGPLTINVVERHR